MRAHGEPSNGAKAEAGMESEADKEDECRRPQRTVMNVNRSRPPAPIVAVIKPPAIVIWRPAPWLIDLPMSSRNRAPKPIFPFDMGPRLLPDKAAKRCHSRGRKSTCRAHQDHSRRCNNGWYGQRSLSCAPRGRDRYSMMSQSSLSGALLTLYSGSVVPRILIISPACTRVLPCGVVISASPSRTITSVSESEFTCTR